MQIYQSASVPVELARKLHAMPKVEIHVHLEGAVDAETIWEMSARNGIPMPVATLDEWRGFYEFRDFPHFARVYTTAARCIRTPEDYSAMVVSFLRRQSDQNIRYSEAYFSPQHHLRKGLSESELLDAIESGADEGRRSYGSRVRFISDVSREMGQDLDRVLPFTLAGRERGGLFVALGIGGIEVGNPPERFASIFGAAAEAGLHVVAHAGETDGPASVWGALRSLRAVRIGHGVRSLEDPSLVTHLRETRVPLEVSPNSNYCLRVVPPDRPHPVRDLVDSGVLVTINSDDPAMFSTSLDNEYVTLAGQGFGWDELWQLNLATLGASFLPEEEKTALRGEWLAFVADIDRR